MSAIWGMIAKQNRDSISIELDMRKHYEKHCIIDRYETTHTDYSFMSCGIQYITHEAESEVLPFYDCKRNILFTADCIIDNRKELLTSLQLPDSTTDGLLIYHSYLKWGTECMSHLVGLYSFAVYDKNEDSLILASDPTSSRCLYYYVQGNDIFFSTLISPILSVCRNIHKNELYLKDYLTLPGLLPSISIRETPYENVFKLVAGTFISIQHGLVTETRYWDPLKVKRMHTREMSAEDCGREFMQLYGQCVSDATRTNGEVGICLSSGYDSASVAALASDDLSVHQKSLYSYTYVPKKDLKLHTRKTEVTNEKDDVLKIVEIHNNIIPAFLDNNGRNCIEQIPEILDITEIPFKSFVNSPNLLEIYRAAHDDQCKIVLSGQVGNSTVSFGYIDNVLFNLYTHHHYLTFLNYLNHFSKSVKESRKKALMNCIRYFSDSKKELQSKKEFECTLDNPFLDPNILNGYPMEARFSSSHIQFNSKIPLPVTSEEYPFYVYSLGSFSYLGEVETKMGLACGICLRDPTRDIRLIQFCLRIPFQYFSYHGIPRWLITKNFEHLLPKDILSNYLRHGIQNVDYIYRILSDWDQLYPLMQVISQIENPYIDYTKLQTFNNTIQNTSKTNYSMEFMNQLDAYIYLYIYSLYTKSQP